MTAVASPPSFQPLARWNSGNGGQGGLNPMSADEVTRMFMPPKSVQRTNSSSSITSSSSSSSTLTIPANAPQTNGEPLATNGDQGGYGARKKPVRGLWPSSKAEPVSGISKARPQPLPTATSGQSAASTMSAIHQPSPILPSQNRIQPQTQQNGVRIEPSTNQTDPPAVLALHPLTSTFERKHITVPYFPEVLRIGRQTNAKTVPTAVNGYFDSKVLSRQHAEVWADRNGKIWIRDVKSSNGTFVNGVRLSPENRDSEPHELREHDTLELGIDIVSEDQKSIVHHKVSAKVEHAGIYTNGTNILDLNFGDIDPNSGNSIPMGPQVSQVRGRNGSQVSISSNGRMSAASMAGSHANGMGPQRQMNFWLNPITIEQVVKKLTTELKQAKQQSQDLHRTGDFFTTLLTLEPGEVPPDPPESHAPEEKKPNGLSPTTHLEPVSPFSQPPAPPPQQPLPEKPDVARSAPSLMPQNHLKSIEAGRPKSATNSPTRTEPPSSQILSLVEALTTAKREIDSQGDRVKQLEAMLKRERKAREGAEERARRLLAGHSKPGSDENGTVEEEASEQPVEPPVEPLSTDEIQLPNGHTGKVEDRSEEAASTSAQPETHSTASIDATTTRLQEKLDMMVREMDEMKIVMENYKRRAETAEHERKGLAEMVQQIRANTAAAASENGDERTVLATGPSQSSDNASSDSTRPTSASDSTSSNASQTIKHLNGRALPSFSSSTQSDHSGDGMDELHRTVSTVLQEASKSQQRWGRVGGAGWSGGDGTMMVQGAPYASMVGVVLIGVGIMTWLNGWQRGER